MTKSTTQPNLEFDHRYAAEQLRRSKHPLRRFIKSFYLRQILRDVRGPCIDFGCGAGQLLIKLPPGSVGLEVNPFLISSLRERGLSVMEARAEIKDFELNGFAKGVFRTLVIAHVLEHLPDPAAALQVLLAACTRIGVERVIIVVPGAVGYASDHTHKTFISKKWLKDKIPIELEGFIRGDIKYFPGNWEWIGQYFVFHEMKIVFDRIRS